MRQLEFEFDRRGPAEVVPFPSVRRRAAIREAAEAVRHHDDPHRWWEMRQACDRLLFGPMVAAGIPRDVIDREEEAFMKAVEAEAARLDVIDYLFGCDEAGGAG